MSKVFNKNDYIEVTIEDIGGEGMGVAKASGYALFIKDALPGDTCRVRITKANKNYGFARVEEVIKESSLRVDPPCENAKRCGGCQIMAMDYEAQLQFKEKKVKDNLERIGGLDFSKDNKESTEFLKIKGMEYPYRYRNKTQYPVGMGKEGNITYGFYAGRTHSIISTEDCKLAAEINSEIMNTIVEFMEEFNIKPYDEKSGNGVVRHVLIRNSKEKSGQIMVCIIINQRSLKKSDILVERLKNIPGMTSISLNVNTAKNNVILGDEVINLYGENYIIDTIKDLKYQISPKSFFQVNGIQTEKLYETAVTFADIKNDDVVWDMYCGIGTMSLFFAKQAKKVYGVEIVPEAIRDAKKNAKLNNIDNATFFCGAAEDVVPKLVSEDPDKYGKIDVVVVDPPRKGCDVKLLSTIVSMNPEKVVYVSCDSATLSRDVKILSENGYRVNKVQPVDMFPHTVHVETVVLMSRV